MTVIIAVVEEMNSSVRDRVNGIIAGLIHRDIMIEDVVVITSALIFTDQTIEGIEKAEISIALTWEVRWEVQIQLLLFHQEDKSMILTQL